MSKVEGIGKRWYVVQSASGSEERVKKLIAERASAEGFSEHFGEIIVPMEEVVEMRGGKRVHTKRCFFPGYVMVYMQINSDTWYLVRGIPGVSGFIGGENGQAAPLSDQEVDRILKRMTDSQERPMPKVSFETGEVVRIIDGPFADFDAVVEQVNTLKSSLQVSVTVFGRPTPIELSFKQVIKN